MTRQQKILTTLVLLFFAGLFFPNLNALNLVITVSMVVYSFTLTSLKQKKQLLKSRTFIYWMIAFACMVLLSMLLSNNIRQAFHHFNVYSPIFYFPLSIGLIQIQKELHDKILSGIAILITFAAVVCIGFGIYQSVTFNNTAYLYNDALSYPVVGQQSIYFSLLVNFSIYIFTYLFFYQPLYRKYRSLLLVAIIILFITSFLLASRNMMLVLYSSALVFAFYNVFKKKKYLEGATMIMGLFIAVFLTYKFFPKTFNRFKELSYTQFNYQQDGAESHYDMKLDSSQWNGANFRMAAWRCGWELFKQNPLIGVNIGDKKTKLMAIYREKNFEFAIRTQKNLHNNYLDILSAMGIIGLTVFLLGWIILPIRTALQHKDKLALLMIITIAFGMITENYLDRTLGGMLLGFFIPFLHSDKTAKN